MRVNGDEGTPVPIPNTVVKLIYGDNTWLATAWEDNSTRTRKSSFERDCFLFYAGKSEADDGRTGTLGEKHSTLGPWPGKPATALPENSPPDCFLNRQR